MNELASFSVANFWHFHGILTIFFQHLIGRVGNTVAVVENRPKFLMAKAESILYLV